MRTRVLLFALAALLLSSPPARAHFGMVIPDETNLSRPGEVTLSLIFWHPFENKGMDLEKPQEVGVFLMGKKTDISGSLKDVSLNGKKTWTASYAVKRPGDYYFFMTPQPYWEQAEEKFIVHYTKAPVSALGMEEGWEEAVGLPVEIIPLTRPYGLYAGNSFTGKVVYQGKPLADTPVEVEFYNPKNEKKAPTDAHITQVVKTDPNGIFTFNLPWSGWWGMAALHEDEAKTVKKDGKDMPLEQGGVIWVKVD